MASEADTAAATPPPTVDAPAVIAQVRTMIGVDIQRIEATMAQQASAQASIMTMLKENAQRQKAQEEAEAKKAQEAAEGEERKKKAAEEAEAKAAAAQRSASPTEEGRDAVMVKILELLGAMQTNKETKEEPKDEGKETMTMKRNLLQRLERDPLSERRGLMAVDKYSGTSAFKDWRFSIRGVLDTEPLLARRLDAIEKAALKQENRHRKVAHMQVEVPDVGVLKWTASDYESDEEKLDRVVLTTLSDQLFHLLRTKFTGPMSVLLQNLEGERTRGFEAWARVVADAQGETGPRMISLATEVLHPKKASKLDDVPMALEAYKASILQFETLDQEKRWHSIKFFGLLGILPNDMSEELLKRYTEYDDNMEAAYRWALDQHAVRRKPDAKRGLHMINNDDATGEEPIPSEAWDELSPGEQFETVNELMAFAKGKGKGKSSSGGGQHRFPCKWCGKENHMSYECWIKDAEMEAKRAQDGKGNGKNGQKGPGSPPSAGKGGWQPQQGSWNTAGGGWQTKGTGKAPSKGHGKGAKGKGGKPGQGLARLFSAVLEKDQAIQWEQPQTWSGQPPGLYHLGVGPIVKTANSFLCLEEEQDCEEECVECQPCKDMEDIPWTPRPCGGHCGECPEESAKLSFESESGQGFALSLRKQPSTDESAVAGRRAEGRGEAGLLGVLEERPNRDPEARRSGPKRSGKRQRKKRQRQQSQQPIQRPTVPDQQLEQQLPPEQPSPPKTLGAMLKAMLCTLEIKDKAQSATAAPAVGAELLPLESRYLSRLNGWTKLTGVADSGAVHHVCPSGAVTGYPTRESEMSKRGMKYTAANSGEIPNEGEQVLPTYSLEGCYAVRRLQQAEVAKPLFSVGEECDQSRLVLFGQTGGAILHLDTEEVEWFPRTETGSYEMTIWVPPAPGSPEALQAGFHSGMASQ